MNNILDLIKTPKDVNNDIVKRMRARRKEQTDAAIVGH